MRKALLLLALGAAGVLPSAASARAEQAPATDWLTAVGSPAEAAAVTQACRRAYAEGYDAIRALAEALGQAGGHAAAEGLAEILAHRRGDQYAPVRLTALAAAMRLDLRSAALLESIHGCLETSEHEERLAAFRALSRVGDGRDVPALLELTKAEDRRTQKEAYRALRHMAGVELPYVAARWAQWWRKKSARVGKRVEAALGALEAAPGAADAPRHRKAIVGEGWMHLAEVEARLGRWLKSNEDLLRAEACLLAADLRLADLAPAIADLGVSTFHADELVASAAAARLRLGIPDAE